MDTKAVASALEEFAKGMPFGDPQKYRDAFEKIEQAANPEHVGAPINENFFSDKVKCSCGWESNGYYDMLEAAWDEWINHLANTIGLNPKKCPCGKAYTPFRGETACHELKPI